MSIISPATRFVSMNGRMKKPVAKVTAEAAKGCSNDLPAADLLLRAFTDARDELTSTLWYVLGNQEEAFDVAQEAFLRCWRNLDTLAEVQNLKAWIFRVALNAAKDLQRSAWNRRVKPLIGAEAQLTGAGCSPVTALEEKETLERLRQAIMGLREEEQEVYLLRENGDLTFEEIAEALARPVGTVKTQMRSALQKLRKQLAP